MKEKILHIVRGTEKFLCIEVCFHKTGVTYNTLEISKKENQLSLGDKGVFEDIDELAKVVSKNAPVILSFTGHSIITKKVKNTPKYRASILFNANMDDFYWYEVPQSDEIFVSVIRKQSMFEEIDQLEDKGFSVVDISIGPFVARTLKSLLPELSSIHTPNYELQFENQELINFQKRVEDTPEASPYILGEESIETNSVIPFSSLLFYLYPNDGIEADKEFLKSKRQEFKYKRAFNLAGIIGLSLLFCSLLVSYLLLGYYQNEYMELEVVMGEKNIAHNKLSLLEEDQKNKQAILLESGLNNNKYLVEYISEITKDTPSEINLTELALFPPTRKIKPKERIRFNQNLIQINGTVSSNQSFTEWIQDLKESKWVESLEIIDFVKNGRESSFEIKLTLVLDV